MGGGGGGGGGGWRRGGLQSNKLSDFSIKTYNMGTQKNRLNETVLLSTKLYIESNV